MSELYFVVPTIENQQTDIDFNKYLKPTLKEGWFNNLLIMSNEYGNSIFEKYNKAIELLENKLKNDDIVCFLHSDISILDNFLEEKIKLIFDKRKDIGIVGIYGTTNFNDKMGWWLNDRKIYGRGHIIQGLPDGSEFHMVDKIGFFDDIVVVDGCLIFIKGELLKNKKFRTDMNGYHHYENSYCIETLYETDFKIAVADILVKHMSEGPLNNDWFKNGLKLANEYKEKGIVFPIDLNNINKKNYKYLK